MYYLIYKITNNINGKIYIGRHKTDRVDDSYFGSGVALNRAIKKYGKSNFTKEILHYCESYEDMVSLEREIVSEDFIKRSDVYNLMVGGEFQPHGLVTVIDTETGEQCQIPPDLYKSDNRYVSIHKDESVVYDKIDRRNKRINTDHYRANLDRYISVIAGTVAVYDKLLKSGTRVSIEDYKNNKDRYRQYTEGTIAVVQENDDKFVRIDVSEYQDNKHLYKTPSTNRISVRYKETGETAGISLDDFDPDKHEKVIGGIVVEINGVRQYIDRETFDNEDHTGIHVGKVTVFDKSDGRKKHVTVEEYYQNKDQYTANGTGTFVVKNILTGKGIRVTEAEYQQLDSSWVRSTAGQRTVFDLTLNKFINIPSQNFDRNIHRLCSDRKYTISNTDGIVLFQFIGTKKDFLKTARLPERAYNCAKTGEKFVSDRRTHGYSDVIIKVDYCDFHHKMEIKPPLFWFKK